MAVEIPTVDQLLDKGIQLFRHHFQDSPVIAGIAPGRVNIIGEHTDYNDGFVFPMALPMVTIVLGKQNFSDEIKIATESHIDPVNPTCSFNAPAAKMKLTPGEPKWANYVKGVVQLFPEEVMGFNAVVVTSVPAGAGLSSSAALEVATFSFLEGLTNHNVDGVLKATICQQAEHEFAAVPCGIMDQLISSKGVENKLLLLDCRSLQTEEVEIEDTSLAFLVINTNVKHDLGGTNEYALRKSACDAVAKYLNVKALRDASMNDIDALYKKEEISELMYRRARHVIKENLRVCEAAAAIKKKDWNSLGLLMNQSHNSLRFDYDVSCPELDSLVEIAMRTKGVYGARMTGGGFGGCTVNLVKKDYIEFIINEIQSSYSMSNPTFMIGVPSQGARIVNIDKLSQDCAA